MKKVSERVISIFGKVCLLLLIFTAVLLVRRLYLDAMQIHTEKEIQELIQSAKAEEAEKPVMTEQMQPDPDPVCAEAYEKNQDFLCLLEAGEDIALFVVQGEDNSYYMNHDFYGRESPAGNVFLDARNSLNPRDTHWIMHGHNMKNGTAFGNLDRFRNKDYLEKYPIVTLTMMYDKEYYVPYAVLDISAEKTSRYYYKVTEWNFDTEEDMIGFTDALKARALYPIPVDVNAEDDLLTLSTCSYGYENGRLLIACRKLREGELPEEVGAIVAGE